VTEDTKHESYKQMLIRVRHKLWFIMCSLGTRLLDRCSKHKKTQERSSSATDQRFNFYKED